MKHQQTNPAPTLPFQQSSNLKSPPAFLLSQYRLSQNPNHLGGLFNKYSHLVLGTCIKYLKDESMAEDAQMEIFQKLILMLKNFTPHNFEGWLYRVTVNHCLEILRSRKRNPFLASIEDIDEREIEFSMDHHGDLAERKKTLFKAMQSLPCNQRTCLQYFFFNQLSYKEIAEELNWDLKKVKSSIQNGKRNLRKSFLHLAG